MVFKDFIGVSLSEPHTSVTALAEVVCMFAAIHCKFKMSVFHEDRVVSCMQYAQPAVASVKDYCQRAASA